MTLPFTTSEFLEVMHQYNAGVWPLQLLVLALGLAAVWLAFRGGAVASRAAGGILALLWLWSGIAFHLSYFAAINSAAVLFALAFVLQAAAVAWAAGTGRLVFDRAVALRWPGTLLIGYAFIAYPVLNAVLGHPYPMMPTFGSPCPMTIATFGLLLWARPPVPIGLYVVPLLWAALGTSAALELGMLEDLGLTVAAAVMLVTELARRISRTPSTAPATNPGRRNPR